MLLCSITRCRNSTHSLLFLICRLQIEFYRTLFAEFSCDFLFSICLLFSLCSLLLSSLLSSSLWLDRSANFCLMLLTCFLESLSNPIIIVTICVPKRRMKMICIDCQVFMFCASKVDGVENEESMWKHSPKNWGMKTLLSSVR